MGPSVASFDDFLTDLRESFPPAFVDNAYLLRLILAGEPPLGLSSGSRIEFAQFALEKFALRRLGSTRVARPADVLVTHFPAREDYVPFLAPVVAELRRQGFEVAVTVPPSATELEAHYPDLPVFALHELATPTSYLLARRAVAGLASARREFVARYLLPARQSAYLSVVLQAYEWQRALFGLALRRTGARVVVGLHTMLDPGIRAAIRDANKDGQKVSTLYVQHGVFSGDWPTHDFHGADRVLLWSDAAAAALRMFPGPLPSIAVTGNPKLEWLRSLSTPPGGTNREQRQVDGQVLVLGTNGESDRDVRALRLAATALQGIGPDAVIFRPHPAEPRERYLKLVAEGLLDERQISYASDPYPALRNAVVVIGTQSTLLLEAAALGTPAIQLLPHEMELNWAENGMPSANTADELRDLVNRMRSVLGARSAALAASQPLVEATFGPVDGAAARAAGEVARLVRDPRSSPHQRSDDQVSHDATPKVTIMIPTYGQATILHEAIDSALAQTYPNLEVLVADDASPDATPAVMSAYAHERRVRYVRRDPNLGRVGNYRATLTDAAGDFVLNLDGDDWLSDPTYVADAMALVAEHPDLALVFGRSQSYRQATGTLEDEPINRDLPTVCDGTRLFLAYADGRVTIPHMTALYRRDIALSLGFYEHDVIGADSVAFLLLLPGRRVGFIDRPVGVWRQHASNATWSSDISSRRANFVVADEPARAAMASGAVAPDAIAAWHLKMSARLGHQAMADSIMHGRAAVAALMFFDMLRARPRAAFGAIGRLFQGARRRLSASARHPAGPG